MKVSIIVPVYNVSRYIIRCLHSVGSQTFTDVECILVDDCGVDDSLVLAEDYINNYSGDIVFSIIHHLQNKGLSAARNTGIINAKGDYVFFLDSDDSITPDCIDTLVSLALKYPEADFIQGNTVSGGQGLVNHHFGYEVPEACINKVRLDELIFFSTIINSWNRLVKRSFILKNSLFFPSGIIHEDMYWAFFLAKNTRMAAFTPKGTYYYFFNGESIMNSKSPKMIKKRLNGYYISVMSFFHDMAEYGSTSRFQRQFLADSIVNYLLLLLSIFSVKEWIKFWKMIIIMSVQMIPKSNKYRVMFCFSLLPPCCFIMKLKKWEWRIRHYVCSKI